MDKNGNVILKTATGETAETVLMDGSMVADAQAGMQQETGKSPEYVVNLTLTEEGKTKFAEITSEYNGKVVSIWMDDIMISAPTVNAVISDGKAVISGSFTAASATDLANKIKAGALPFELQTVTYGNISPTLGQNALLAMAWAAAIAFVISVLPSPGLHRRDLASRSDGSDGSRYLGLLPDPQFLYHDAARYRRSDPVHRYGR